MFSTFQDKNFPVFLCEEPFRPLLSCSLLPQKILWWKPYTATTALKNEFVLWKKLESNKGLPLCQKSILIRLLFRFASHEHASQIFDSLILWGEVLLISSAFQGFSKIWLLLTQSKTLFQAENFQTCVSDYEVNLKERQRIHNEKCSFSVLQIWLLKEDCRMFFWYRKLEQDSVEHKKLTLQGPFFLKSVNCLSSGLFAVRSSSAHGSISKRKFLFFLLHSLWTTKENLHWHPLLECAAWYLA